MARHSWTDMAARGSRAAKPAPVFLRGAAGAIRKPAPGSVSWIVLMAGGGINAQRPGEASTETSARRAAAMAIVAAALRSKGLGPPRFARLDLSWSVHHTPPAVYFGGTFRGHDFGCPAQPERIAQLYRIMSMSKTPVVDDDRHLRGLAGRVLKGAGHVTFQADNGLAAYHIIVNSPVNSILLLVDVHLPAVHGAELVRRIAPEYSP